MNQNWARWIFASTTKFFDANRQGYTLNIEGNDPSLNIVDNWFDFRLTGPTFKVMSKGEYQIDITINILINTLRGNDNHLVHKMIGTVQNCFDIKCINVFKYGDSVDDDQSYVGTLQLISDIATDFYGQISPDIRLLNATVEGDYRMYLSE